MAENFTDKFFESLHKSEFERKDKHESGDSFLLATLSVLGSVGLYFIKLVPDAYNNGARVFIIFTVIYGAAIGFATFCVAWSVWPRWVAYPSDPEDLRNYVEGLRSHFVVIDPSEAALNEVIDKHVIALARDQYARCAANNRRINQTKLSWQTRAREAISISIILLLLNAIPTFFLERTRSNVQDVRLANWPESIQPTTVGRTNDRSQATGNSTTGNSTTGNSTTGNSTTGNSTTGTDAPAP